MGTVRASSVGAACAWTMLLGTPASALPAAQSSAASRPAPCPIRPSRRSRAPRAGLRRPWRGADDRRRRLDLDPARSAVPALLRERVRGAPAPRLGHVQRRREPESPRSWSTCSRSAPRTTSASCPRADRFRLSPERGLYFLWNDFAAQEPTSCAPGRRPAVPTGSWSPWRTGFRRWRRTRQLGLRGEYSYRPDWGTPRAPGPGVPG